MPLHMQIATHTTEIIIMTAVRTIFRYVTIKSLQTSIGRPEVTIRAKANRLRL